jgi:TolB protein
MECLNFKYTGVIKLFIAQVFFFSMLLGIGCKQSTTNNASSGKTNQDTVSSHGHNNQHGANTPAANATITHYPQEKHLANIRQLTNGGDNAEAYFALGDSLLVLQITNKEKNINCDQIFYGSIPQKPEEEFKLNLISKGGGGNTCSFFMGNDQQIIYASTFHRNPNCPEKTDWRKTGKYVWDLFAEFDLFVADKSGKIIKQLTNNKVYDAEATLSPNGKQMVFTSTRNGDIDLYTMNVDGSNIKQITNQLGYDGGAFFSPNGKEIVFRASRPQTPEEQKEYKDLLAKNLVMPTNMEIYVCNADGSNLRQVTKLGKANWAPYFHPDGKRIVFASNHHAQGRGFKFNLFMINVDGSNLQQITFDETFDSFPMFSYDGKKLVFSSNRNNGGTRDTNIFIADWVENTP